MNQLLQTTFDKPSPLYRQITDRVRDLIRSGQLPSGTKLPSTHELAAQWNTTSITVHMGIQPLVKEGLVTRVPRRGTFVRKLQNKLQRVAIDVMQDVDSTTDAPFIQANLKALRNELGSRGIESDVWSDPRPREQQVTPWPALELAAREQRIQAVILPRASWNHIPWFIRLPVPCAFAHSANLPNTVHVDVAQLADLGLEALARQGCRSVGVITALNPQTVDPGGQPHDHSRFFKRLKEEADRLGLELCDPWIRTPTDELGESQPQEAFGYRQLLQLWKLPRHPDGLLAYPHSISRGVIMGLLETQIRVPKELRLALHKNVGVELFCPMSATWIQSDEREVAEKLVDLVDQQFHGRDATPRRWSMSLAEHDFSVESSGNESSPNMSQGQQE
ncbi:MAG: GntR family transcriptional regulator [Phycisphaeraceae bacterium]|nr:GntR family transcriptional regulator [Phycisphaeraceae bacterium]